MSVLAGIFLIAHGLVHVAVWIAPPPPDAPFDSHHSWLFGEIEGPSRALAVLACALLALAGVLVIAGASLGATLAIAGAAVSLLLVLATFYRWFAFAVAINVAIIVVAAG